VINQGTNRHSSMTHSEAVKQKSPVSLFDLSCELFFIEMCKHMCLLLIGNTERKTLAEYFGHAPVKYTREQLMEKGV
jgi:hypothetical protein